MAKNKEYDQKLLVEGGNDQHVVWALCQSCKIAENFNVADCDGIENLLSELPVRLKGSGISTIGVIVDADINLSARWQSIRSILIKEGFTISDTIPSTGLIISNNEGKKVGVWIMPNNNTNGMLEDFMAFLIPENDDLLPIVISTLSDIESRNLNRYKPLHKAKAVIHTWLAWQENPGTPMGFSITKKYLTTNNETCAAFVAWLTELFGK